MAKFTITRASDLGDRWDASFHIALNDVRSRIDELKETISPEEAIERLKGIPLQDKAPLKVLARGQVTVFNSAMADRVTNEYPYLSLAIMEKNLQPAIDRIREEIAKHQASLDALLALGQPSPPTDDEAPAGPKL